MSDSSLAALYSALDAERSSRGLAWAAASCGRPASGHGPLVGWRCSPVDPAATRSTS